jgi:hypothetical protein
MQGMKTAYGIDPSRGVQRWTEGEGVRLVKAA